MLMICSIWAIGLFQFGCTERDPLMGPFFDTSGNIVDLSAMAAQNEGLILAFVAPECPLCISYGPTLGQRAIDTEQRGIPMIGVVSGTYYRPDEIEAYLDAYGMQMTVILDSTFVLARHYEAKFTPEVHLIDQNGEAKYRGAIDNWAISLGQKRIRPTEHYLSDAVENYLTDKPINPSKTEAVGCFIE